MIQFIPREKMTYVEMAFVAVVILFVLYIMYKSNFSVKAGIIDGARQQIAQPGFKYDNFRNLVPNTDPTEYHSVKSLLHANPSAPVSAIDQALQH
jgi:hypothetical protein